jgi:hypothetical protein
MLAQGNPYRKQQSKFRPHTTITLADGYKPPRAVPEDIRHKGIASVGSLSMAEAMDFPLQQREEKEAERTYLATIIKYAFKDACSHCHTPLYHSTIMPVQILFFSGLYTHPHTHIYTRRHLYIFPEKRSKSWSGFSLNGQEV